MPNVVRTSVVTSDTSVKAAEGRVYWLAVSAGATGGAFQVNDSTNDSGTDLLDITMPASTTQFFDFSDAPIRCVTGIYVDVPGTNVTVNVGYQ